MRSADAMSVVGTSIPKSNATGRLVAINLLSFAAQIVQIGTVPPALALRLQALGASSIWVGAVAAGPWIAILVMGNRVPEWLQRWGFVRSALAGVATSTLAVLAMIEDHTAAALLAWNLVFGVGLIVRWVVCDTWIVAAAPAHYRGRAIGVHETLMGCGIAAGPLIIALSGTSTTKVLIVCAALLGLSAVTAWLLRRNTEAVPSAPVERGDKSVKGVSTAIFAGALAGIVETSCISFVPLLAARGHWVLAPANALIAFGLGGTLLQSPLGWLADRVGFRRAQLISAGTLAGTAALIPLAVSAPFPLLALLFLLGGTAGGMNTLAVIEAGQTATETARTMWWIALAYTVGSIAGPLLTGLFEIPAPRLGLSALAFLSGAVFLIVRARRSR